MGVSTRNTVLASLAAAAAFTIGAAAYAGGGMGGSPCAGFGCGGGDNDHGRAPAPGIPHGQAIALPGVSGGSGAGCCDMPKGQNVVVPGVNVAGPNIAVTTPNVGVRQGQVSVGGGAKGFSGPRLRGSSGGGVLLSGGGAAYAPAGTAPATLKGLNVSGGEERYTETVMQSVPVRKTVCVRKGAGETGTRPVQAVCLDDTGTPHPASRVSAEKTVGADYEGEIYRCMDGTAMQVTVGQIKAGKADFSAARTFACRKGEALVHAPGGKLSCKSEIPRRDCNERSLLRRHGPGTKLVQMTGPARACVPEERTVMKKVERQVERVRPNRPAGPITFDGGVGQGLN